MVVDRTKTEGACAGSLSGLHIPVDTDYGRYCSQCRTSMGATPAKAEKVTPAVERTILDIQEALADGPSAGTSKNWLKSHIENTRGKRSAAIIDRALAELLKERKIMKTGPDRFILTRSGMNDRQAGLI